MIHYDLPMADYLAHPGIGSSTLKNIMHTPADFKAALKRKSGDTKATVLGTAVHTAILEPDTFNDRYAIQSEDWGPKNSGEGRKKWNDFKKDNDGKIIIGYEDASFLIRVKDAVKNHDQLYKIVKNGKAEVTGFSKYNETIELKARADLIYKNEIWDVKTTSESLDDDNLFKIVFNSGYHFQAAHHMKVFNDVGVEINSFGWIFVSTKTPAVHIRVVKSPKTLLDWGKSDHEYALKKLQECLEKDTWNGYSPDILELSIPDWARKMYE